MKVITSCKNCLARTSCKVWMRQLTNDEKIAYYGEGIIHPDCPLDEVELAGINLKIHAEILKYNDFLQKAIETHCKGGKIPDDIAENCPYHAEMLNALLEDMPNAPNRILKGYHDVDEFYREESEMTDDEKRGYEKANQEWQDKIETLRNELLREAKINHRLYWMVDELNNLLK